MAFFVRKIEQSKWQQNKICDGADVSADAITSCMRTTSNSLSIWHIEDDTQVNDAVLAIISKHQHLDAIDVVLVCKEDISALDLQMISSPGDTPVEALVNNHFDLVNLNYSSLGKFAKCIVDSFKKNRVRRFSKATLKEILQTAIDSDRLKLDDLAPSLASKLK